MYKQAAVHNVLFATPQGRVPVSSLVGMKAETLDAMAMGIKRHLDDYAVESLLPSKAKGESKEQATQQLRYDILADLIKDKVEAAEAREQAKVRKARKDRLSQALRDIEEGVVASMSKEEIEEELKKL